MATRPAPRYAKDPIALAKLRRERAFSSPAPKVKVKAKPTSYNRFGIGVKPGDSVGQDVIGGTSGPISEATGLGDFINRLGRNYTVDVGDATSRVIQDTFLGGKGKSSLIDNGGVSLAEFARNPSASVAKFITNNALNNSDAMQVAAPGDFIGAGSLAKGAATVAAKVAKPLIPIVSSKAGKIAAAGAGALATAGVASPEDAQAASPTIVKPGLRLLSKIFSGQAGDARKIVPEQLLNAEDVLINTYDSVSERALNVGRGLQKTLDDKQDSLSKDLREHTINGVKMEDLMVSAGLPGRFMTSVDKALDTGENIGVKAADLVRNTDMMDQLNPVKSMVESVKAPDSVGGWYTPRGKANSINENDHAAGAAGAAQIIKEQAARIIGENGKGMLDQDWFDESQKLLDVVNSVNNIQTVSRVWNQLKSKHPPALARKLLAQQYPALEKHMGKTDYFDYLFDEWTKLVDSQPFGLNESQITGAYNNAPPWWAR